MKLEKLKLGTLGIELSKDEMNKSNKVALSMTVDASAEYTTNAQEYFRKAMIGENSSRSKFRQVLGVKDRVKLGNVLFDSLIKAGACAFDPTNSTASQKTFEVTPLTASTEVCIGELEIAFMSDQLQKGSRNFSDKFAFMNFFYETLGMTLQEEMEFLTWRGDTAGATGTYLDTLDGLEKQLTNDADVLNPAGTPVAITSSNIVSILVEARDTLNAANPAVTIANDFVYMLSVNAYNAYADAISENQASGQYYMNGGKELNFQGVPVVRIDGASANVVVAGQLDNFLNIQDLLTDETGFEVVDFYKTTLDRKIGVRTDFKFIPSYIKGDEIYFYAV